MNKPWNTTMELDIDSSIKAEFDKWKLKNDKKRKKEPLSNDLIEYLSNLYNDGYGLKVIARAFDTTYSKLRSLFEKNNIEIRKGRDVVTERVKAFRSKRVKGLNNPWSDPDCRTNIHSFGIQGYYIKADGQKIWLRSCWEYIFAKWLDKNEKVWTYETKQFKLSNGESYRPDFFVNDKIIEIKGYNKERLYKTDMLREEYNIDVIVIEDIGPYCETNYFLELEEWKLKKLEK